MIDRYQAIQEILDYIKNGDLVVSTTGMISRELCALNDRPGNFYMIGSMGLASAVGLGLAIKTPNKKVFILEGDGSALMSMGTLPLIAAEKVPNLIHVVLDNESYESTGGQPSISSNFDLAQTAITFGYPSARRVNDVDELRSAMSNAINISQLSLILVKSEIAPVEGIPRISHSPTDLRDRFLSDVQSD